MFSCADKAMKWSINVGTCMKLLLLAVLCSFPFSLIAQDIRSDPAYQAVAAYDNYAGNLIDSDGNWKKPQPNIMGTLRTLKAEIQESAKKHGVDPVMVAAVIMTENSVNVTVEDSVQNLLGKLKFAKKGEILGKKMSFGLGQLYFTAAREAENYTAKKEGRTPRDDDTINDALFIPEQNIELIAMVIKKVQDDYLKQGFVIDDNIAVTSTLYNLGRSEARAAASKAKLDTDPNYKVRTNFFGLFAKKYEAQLAFMKVKLACLAPAFKATPKDLTDWNERVLLKSIKACGESLQRLTMIMIKEAPSKEKEAMLTSLRSIQTNQLKAEVLATEKSKRDEATQFAKVCEKLAQTYDVRATVNKCSYLSIPKVTKATADSGKISRKLFMNAKGIQLFEDQTESSLEENQRACDPTNTKKFEF